MHQQAVESVRRAVHEAASEQQHGHHASGDGGDGANPKRALLVREPACVVHRGQCSETAQRQGSVVSGFANRLDQRVEFCDRGLVDDAGRMRHEIHAGFRYAFGVAQSAFSTWAWHAAQVMPSTSRVMVSGVGRRRLTVAPRGRDIQLWRGRPASGDGVFGLHTGRADADFFDDVSGTR